VAGRALEGIAPRLEALEEGEETVDPDERSLDVERRGLRRCGGRVIPSTAMGSHAVDGRGILDRGADRS